MKEKLKVNPSKVSVSFFKQRNGAIGGTRYVAGDYLGNQPRAIANTQAGNQSSLQLL